MKSGIVSLLIGLLVCAPAALAKEPLKKVRIGWQVPWAIQGQIVQVWKHTDILAKQGLEAEFFGKTFGPELNELALAGQVDVILTADQPAAILFSKSGDWRGIARLMYNRTSTYVPPASPIQSVRDLKGKTVGVPFGAAAERVAREAVAEAGLAAGDVHFVNLGMLEHGALVKRGGKTAKKWDSFDALSGFDPAPALFEANGMARKIHEGRVCAMLLAKKTAIGADGSTARALTRALGEAWAYYKKHRAEADQWFFAEAKMEPPSAAALQLIESMEPNYRSVIRIEFTPADFELMQKGADFASLVTKKKIDMKKFVSNEFAGP